MPKYRAFRVSFLTIFYFIFWGVNINLSLYLYKKSVIQKLSKTHYIIEYFSVSTKPNFCYSVKEAMFYPSINMDIFLSKIKAVNANLQKFSSFKLCLQCFFVIFIYIPFCSTGLFLLISQEA